MTSIADFQSGADSATAEVENRRAGPAADNQRLAYAAQADLLLLTAQWLRRPPARSTRAEPATLPIAALPALAGAEVAELLAAAQLSSKALSDRLEDVSHQANQLTEESWRDEYARLFEGGVRCPLTEASYVRRDKGAILGDVCGFYQAFGWNFKPQTGERADHLVCELEFAAALLGMASQAGDSEQHDLALGGLAQFVQSHLAEWIAPCCWQLCTTTALPFFAAVAVWVDHLWRALATYHGWPTAVDQVESRPPIAEPDEAAECGAAEFVQLMATNQGVRS